jgi:CheY-like chemotaxis protein
LIVEDDYNNYLLLETLLQPTKARVINVNNGLEAGCDAFIRKLLNTTLLMDTMKKLFHHYDKQK